MLVYKYRNSVIRNAGNRQKSSSKGHADVLHSLLVEHYSVEADTKWLLMTSSSQIVGVSVCFQDEKDMCEEEDLVRNKANISANRKRQLWWEARRGTDEKNVRQQPEIFTFEVSQSE